MRVLLLQLDGKIPNLALMRISAHHREMGDDVVLRRGDHATRIAPQFADEFGKVYASVIFKESLPLCNEVLRQWPDAIIGGSAWDRKKPLEKVGISTQGSYDWDLYPRYEHSIGFSQRGCRLNCGFCAVPEMEGSVRAVSTIAGVWRGAGHPKNILLLDNDFFGQPDWRGLVREIHDGGYKVCWNQGINARFITDEAADAVGAIKVCDDQFSTRRLYTAWDNRKDEHRLFAGLERLVKYGRLTPDQIMVYVLIGYWPGETLDGWEYRRKRLREFGCRPYPMAFIDETTSPDRVKMMKGFQRWVIRRADLKMSWEEFAGANYRPEDVTRETPTFPLFEEAC